MRLTLLVLFLCPTTFAAEEPEGRRAFIAASVAYEPLARYRLSRLLEADPEIEVIAERADAREAVTERDGFEVLRSTPQVVFVTAYDQFAIRAFEANTLDYLLKPFRREPFLQTLARAKARAKRGEPALVAPQPPLRLTIHEGRNIVLLPYDEICRIEAANKWLTRALWMAFGRSGTATTSSI